MNLKAHLPPPPDASRVALADAISTAFLDRLERERRDAQRRQSRCVVALPVDVFETVEFYLIG